MAFAPNGSPELLGQVVSVTGSQAGIDLAQPNPAGAAGEGRVAVGKFLAIDRPRAAVIAQVDGDGQGQAGKPMRMKARVKLLGEIQEGNCGPRFQRGITEHPGVGDTVSLLGREGLRAVRTESQPCPAKDDWERETRAKLLRK